MIDTDDLDRMLRDGIASAADLDVAPSDPAQRVATRVRRRRRRRTAVRASLAGAVTVLAVVAFALSRPTRVTAPADHPTLTPPSVLSTPQVATDRFARTLLGDRQTAIDWTSVRLLRQQGQARVFGARTTQGDLCSIIVVPSSKGLGSATDCGGRNKNQTARAAAAGFAAVGSEETMGSPQGISAFGFFVPDSVRSATVDGVPVPVTRNGLLVVFDAKSTPSTITLSSATGTVTVSRSRYGPLTELTGSFDGSRP